MNSRALPKRSTAVPPALVDRLPPMVQLPSDASDNGKRRPAAAAASCVAASVTPASTVIVALAVSSARTASMRVSATTTWSRASIGVAPPHMPVLPPCVTIAHASRRAGAHHRGDLVHRASGAPRPAPERDSGHASR